MADARFPAAPAQKLSALDNLFLISLLVGPIIYLFVGPGSPQGAARDGEARARRVARGDVGAAVGREPRARLQELPQKVT